MNITQSQGNYLKLIFELNEDGIVPSNKILSDRMAVSPPSVSEMIKKLRSLDLLHDDKLELSAKGEEIAKTIISKHRLWETFLIKELGYSWTDVHEDAEKLESVSSPVLYNRINIALDKPKQCPHGKTIYMNSSKSKDRILLLDVEEKKEYEIAEVSDDIDLLNYCMKNNLILGTKLKVLEKNKYDLSIMVEIAGNKIQLSKKVCRNIKVREI
ncbi:MAG: metal-dependent transcriptional regulator [Tissierellia bacterium]|nr:metal-dependent transcriptional regulator [Tissierellia bacterium]